jgi:regulator of RNase E activity RraA
MSAAIDIIDALSGIDTPTVCNALIVLDPSLRGKNYTLDAVVPANFENPSGNGSAPPLSGGRPGGGPPVPTFTGYALTAKIVSSEPSKAGHDAMLARRFAYYRYLSQARKPSLIVMEDCGTPRGLGSIWGEINVSIHKGLGLKGAVTNGAIRDLDSLPGGFPLIGGNVCPGSGFAHLVEFDTPVSVFGLPVSPGDLVHADRHGCVVVPSALIAALPAAIARVAQREKTLLSTVNAPDFDYERLVAAWKVFEVK